MLLCRQIWRKVLDAGEDVDRFEVVRCAPGMDGARGHEAPFFEENQPDPPSAFVDDPAARTTMSSTRRGALGAVDARDTTVRDPETGRRDQPIRILERLGSSFDRGQQRFGPLVRTAEKVKPVHRFAFTEGIR